MSLLRQIVGEVIQIRQQLEQQEQVVSEFLRTNQEQMQMVRLATAGSKQGFDMKLQRHLIQAESSLKTTLTKIREAKTALARIETI